MSNECLSKLAMRMCIEFYRWTIKIIVREGYHTPVIEDLFADVRSLPVTH